MLSLSKNYRACMRNKRPDLTLAYVRLRYFGMVAEKATTSCLHGALYWNLVLIFLQLVQAAEELSVNVTVEPHYGCVCPRQSYTCRAYPVSQMSWTVVTNPTDQVVYNIFIFDQFKIDNISRNGLQYTFSEKTIDDAAVITSELLIIAPHRNNTNATCAAFKNENRNFDTVVACITGPASPPTSLSVVWDPPSAVVSFQSPVYGGECVDYYVVTAVSGEESFECDASEKRVHTCFIPNDRSVNDFNFTVYSVTVGVDGVLQNGESVTDCCLSFPGNVNAIEKECNIVQVSWKGNPGAQGNVTISVDGSERAISDPTYHERGSSEDSHLLTLDYSETGPVEIAVTFSSAVCNKTTVTHYLVEGVLTSVYLRSRTLVIESRDCIARPENYRIIIATPTTLVNVSFNATVEYDLGDIVSSGTVITVQLVETTSNTIIDEMTYTITMYPTPTVTPILTPTEPG
ncbi:hypothetical protein GBAR_LOCUS11449 [Geodia barretti]|uniref:Uncharacterized protein n=1 Tax=Geodia barretti TaxID=519541 RepID=A0AA35RZ92_GEOBA|nr:hypothetical protein GBAR_LOCUS11449 [Geodia barretti]